jgi:hypothetical protein
MLFTVYFGQEKMYVITEIVDELRSYNVPDETINRIMKRLIVAGQRTVYAALGECAGVHEITPGQLGVIIGTSMAMMPMLPEIEGTKEVNSVVLTR